MSDRPLTDQRDRLVLEVAEATRRHADALQARDNEWKISAELLAPIWDRRYNRDRRPISFLRRFSDDLLSEIEERGLAFDLSDADRSLVIFDPAVREELADAGEARAAALQRLSAFDSENADAIKREEDAAEAQRIRDAIASDDPTAIRTALRVAA